MNKINERIGNKISRLRKEKSFSQQTLSDKLKISRTAVSQLENGERNLNPSEIIKLTKIFNISANELIDPKSGTAESIEIDLLSEESSKAEKEIIKNTERISIPQKNLKKFKEVLLYVLSKAGAKSNIGETVLYKILFYIDFDYFEKYEEQLIGATYKKNHHGPTPKEFAKIIEQMINKNEVVKIKDKYFTYPQTKYLPLREPDLSVISGREKEMIDEVLIRLSDMNASQISEYSHHDVPWLTTKEGSDIPYESVFYRTAPYSVRNYSGDEDL